ncbi:hypothetical protein NPIL_380921 [Nephila pilipes]|uniref:Uncharacterized protein n=1 Tax=Nephila pilipes TaxID=299642 RepID=A0A8X6IEL0_NEPPI|nr:hypothetical protein NPIL_380921 [Nephila pilipes]
MVPLKAKGQGILEELIGKNSLLNLKGCRLLDCQRVKRRDDWVPCRKDANIDALIQESDKLYADLMANNTDTNRLRFTEISHSFEEEIFSYKRKKWAEFCEKLDPRRISQHWKVIKTLNNQTTLGKFNLQSNTIFLSGRNATTNKETALMPTEHYETKSKLDFIANYKKLLKVYRNSMKFSRNYQINDIFTERIPMEELDFAIAKMDPRKVPGRDLIFGPMVKHFGSSAKKEPLESFNYFLF